MRNVRDRQTRRGKAQRGAAAVEFALVVVLLIVLLLGIIELGRFLYLFNTVQEVTRRAAREAVVLWVDGAATAKSRALFDNTSLPAGAEITAAGIDIEYLSAANPQTLANPRPDSPADNIAACLDAARTNSCIRFVEASISGVQYVPMIGLFVPQGGTGDM